MINRAVLTGRLTKDPELRTTQSGLSVASFNLAVDRPFKDNNGNYGADFISCVIWRKAAENFCNFTSKGSLVGIDGRIQTRNYQDNDGKTVYVTEVLVENFTLLESKKDRLSNNNGGNGNNNAYGNNNNGTNYTTNSSTQSQAPDPFSGSGDTIDITDDDLPF